MRRTLLLLTVLALAACSDAPSPDGPDTPDAPSQSAQAPSGGDASCLVGTWQADVESVYGPDFWERVIPNDDSGLSFAYAGSEGRALMTFGADGSANQQFDNFTVSIDGTTPMGPMTSTMQMNGTTEASYTVNGDRLSMQSGSANVTATSTTIVGGQSMGAQDVPFNDLFGQETGGTIEYTCSSDELVFDFVLPSEEELFTNVRYERVD